MSKIFNSSSDSLAQPHRRRPRYSGKNPRKFEEKYKEHNPERYVETINKVLASGKTPAGTHRPIMVKEILEILNPKPGETAVDCTLGYGGHAQEILTHLQPNGFLLGIDTDPIELPKTEARLRKLGFDEKVFTTYRSNFAGLPQALAKIGLTSVDIILADLGLSSMQIDNPTRGFSIKLEGPLDMRMNPQRGQSASALLEKISAEQLAILFQENSDEPNATILAETLAGKTFSTTLSLVNAIRQTLSKFNDEEKDLSIRRIFQALRIAINDEFSTLETFLHHLPTCLNPGGRIAILTFHSGEDRRVKKAFKEVLKTGIYCQIAQDVIRPSSEECRNNPRSTSAKLRWAKTSL